MKNNSLSSLLFMRFQPFWHIIHLKFTPFTGFTFFNQIPYLSVMQSEGTPCFSGNRAHRLYDRCSLPVCLRLTPRMPGSWKVFTQRAESGNGPSPCTADE